MRTEQGLYPYATMDSGCWNDFSILPLPRWLCGLSQCICVHPVVSYPYHNGFPMGHATQVPQQFPIVFFLLRSCSRKLTDPEPLSMTPDVQCAVHRLPNCSGSHSVNYRLLQSIDLLHSPLKIAPFCHPFHGTLTADYADDRSPPTGAKGLAQSAGLASIAKLRVSWQQLHHQQYLASTREFLRAPEAP
jgi:hypothetical protein